MQFDINRYIRSPSRVACLLSIINRMRCSTRSVGQRKQWGRGRCEIGICVEEKRIGGEERRGAALSLSSATDSVPSATDALGLELRLFTILSYRSCSSCSSKASRRIQKRNCCRCRCRHRSSRRRRFVCKEEGEESLHIHIIVMERAKDIYQLYLALDCSPVDFEPLEPLILGLLQLRSSIASVLFSTTVVSPHPPPLLLLLL